MQDVALTLAEASEILRPAMSETQLAAIIRALRWQPDNWRQTGRKGHPRAVYDWGRICALHAALVPFLQPATQSL